MRRINYLVIILLVIFIYNIDCYAFSKQYKYNYEVTDVAFDGRYGTIEGWAILNAGVEDGSSGTNASPSLKEKYESTKNASYNYSLKVYGINVQGKVIKEVRYIDGQKSTITKQKSLTSLMCQRNGDGECVDYKSPKYENVKFKFNFDFADFSDSTKYHDASYPNESINGYKFVLTVSSTKSNCNDSACTQSFPLTFLEKAVSSNAKKYFDSSTYMDKVYFVANTAKLKTKNCSGGNVVYKVKEAGGTYNIVGTDFCSSSGVTYYKIKVGKYKGWVPASWIAPPKNTFTMILNDICNIDGKQIRFAGVENNVEGNSCESAVNLVDTAKESCITQDSTEYYKITCKDIIDTTFVPSKKNYYRGDDFNIDVKMTAKVLCEGTFEYAKWQNAYNKGDSNTRNNLNQIKKNFENFTMNEYNANPSAIINYKEGNSTKKIRLIIADKKNVSETSKNIEYTNAKKDVPKKLTYVTNVQEISMNLENPIIVDAEKENTPYTINVTNAGFSAKSKVNFSCEIVKKLAIYRPIDSRNPFISSDRIIGDNWKNDKYDFTGIIDENIWSNPNPDFVFFISTNDIENIKKSNQILGTSSYLGTSCRYFNGNYRCDFIRDKDYFTNIFIKGEKIN